MSGMPEDTTSSGGGVVTKEEDSFYIGMRDILYKFGWNGEDHKVYDDEEGICLTLKSRAYDLRLMGHAYSE